MDKIYIAKIGKTVGLKGWQKIYIDTDFPEQFKKGLKLITNKKQQLTVESYNSKNDSVKFETIDSLEDAKKLTNSLLYVSKEDTLNNCTLENNQYFWFDIIDCKIIENDEILGVVSDIQRLPLSDYLQVNTSKSLIEQKYSNNFLLPYLDQFIIDVDLEHKTITVSGAKDILEAS